MQETYSREILEGAERDKFIPLLREHFVNNWHKNPLMCKNFGQFLPVPDLKLDLGNALFGQFLKGELTSKSSFEVLAESQSDDTDLIGQ